MHRSFLLILPLVSVILLSACTTPAATPEATSGVVTATFVPQGEDGGANATQAADVISGEATLLDQLTVQGSGEQIAFVVRGSLPDGCTTISEVLALQISDDSFQVQIFTERPTDLACTEALVPFEEVIPVDVSGLAAGEYSVTAYSLSETFRLPFNQAQQPTAAPQQASCPAAQPGTTLYTEGSDTLGIGFCFLYPEDFEVIAAETPGTATIGGPTRSDNQRSILAIGFEDPAGQGLGDYVNTLVAEAGLDAAPMPITLGASAPAIMVEGFPAGSRVVFVESAGLIYRLTYTPTDSQQLELNADTERIYALVIESWVFLR
ncbi:MAG: hypothetical protein GYB68_09050 [Chloroflexi bacterium]|nr:hypothetical protein [Chloroflexota bacterium]